MKKNSFILAMIVLAGILSAGIGRADARTADNITGKTTVYDEFFGFRKFRAKVKKDGKCGYVDNRGNVVVPLIYEDCYMDNDNRYLSVKLNGKWGYRTVDGKEIIPCIYDEHFEFNPPGIYKNKKTGFVKPEDCFAAVSLNGKHGAIDMSGKEVIPFIYRTCERLKSASDLFVVSTDDRKHGILNVRGEAVIPLSDYFIFPYEHYVSHGIFKVAKYHEKKKYRYMYGFRDAHNNEILPCKYDRLSVFNNVIIAEKDGKKGMFDLKGNEILPCRYYDISGRAGCAGCENLFVVIADKSSSICELMDISSGEVVLRMECRDMSILHDGMLKILIDGKSGIVDRTGRVIVPCEYDYIDDISYRRGFLRAEKDGKHGIIDKKRRVVIPFEYEMCGDLVRNRAIVGLGGKYGFVNRRGKVVIPIEYYRVLGFCYGWATARRNGKSGAIDKRGKTVIPFEYDIVDCRSKSGICNVRGDDGVYMFVDKRGNPIFGYRQHRALYPPEDVIHTYIDEY